MINIMDNIIFFDNHAMRHIGASLAVLRDTGLRNTVPLMTGF